MIPAKNGRTRGQRLRAARLRLQRARGAPGDSVILGGVSGGGEAMPISQAPRDTDAFGCMDHTLRMEAEKTEARPEQ